MVLQILPRGEMPAPAAEFAGVFWMDLAPDGCTMFYTSYGPNVKRYESLVVLDEVKRDFAVPLGSAWRAG